MMTQYLALKREAGDCLLFYRMGDFFELFFDDARVASQVLDIALTSRGEHLGAPIPMCGVPVHAAEGYLARLIRAGCRVAIAEQVESPEEAKRRGGSKALVARDIVRFVTAGTLTEEALLEPRRANVLAAVCELRGLCGIAACDISTGRMELEECRPRASTRRSPGSRRANSSRPTNGPKRPPGRSRARAATSQRRRRHAPQRRSTASPRSTASASSPRAMLAAAGRASSAYLEHAGAAGLPLLLPPVARTGGGHAGDGRGDPLRASRSSRRKDGGRAASLDRRRRRCVTWRRRAAKLAEDLAAPLTARPARNRGRASTRPLVPRRPAAARGLCATCCARCPIIGRALGPRGRRPRARPRDLGQVRDGLTEARRIHDVLRGQRDVPALLAELLPGLAGHGALTDHLSRALVPTPPTERAQGGFIAEGYDHALDELRQASGSARRAIAALEARYRTETGVAALKIRHNGVLGYFIEVPARHADALMAPDSGFTHRQTMAGAVRFNSLHLHEEATRIAEAGGHALAAEGRALRAARRRSRRARETIAATAAALARIDVAAGQAECAAEGGWCRPAIAEDASLAIEGGRHPVVEAALARAGERFVANDCRLAPADRLWLVGGPNMGGKSTFLRQKRADRAAAPGRRLRARRARHGRPRRPPVQPRRRLGQPRPRPLDLHGRDGRDRRDPRAGDRAQFRHPRRSRPRHLDLRRARARLGGGRGDPRDNRCRCLFATHYHELARLAESCPALSLHHVRAKEWQGELVLLHEVAEGAADRSYGLAVAKLAGVPPRSSPARARCSTSSRKAAPKPAALPRASASCRCSPRRSRPPKRPPMRSARSSTARHRRALAARGARLALRAQADRRRAVNP
jgi:DNA mismatch repair protein MutS